MAIHTSHVATHERPRLCVVDIPVIEDFDSEKISRFMNSLRNKEQGNFGRNKATSSKGKPCSSKYKGVSWSRRNLNWDANIKIHGRKKWLGSYDNQKQAARAYDLAAAELFGEHAKTNCMIYPDDFL